MSVDVQEGEKVNGDQSQEDEYDTNEEAIVIFSDGESIDGMIMAVRGGTDGQQVLKNPRNEEYGRGPMDDIFGQNIILFYNLFA